jgi:hypothetical protein
MDPILMVLYVFLVLVYITVYIIKGQGLWKNIEVYTPNWSEKILILVFFYLFVMLSVISFYYNSRNIENPMFKNLNKVLFVLILALFSFVVFCLSEGNTAIEEAFILSSIILGLLLANVIVTFMLCNTSGKIFSVLPLAVYTYLYAWIYEIKNNH